MSREQRRALHEALISAPQPPEPTSIKVARAGFAHLMAGLPVRDDVRQSTTSLGDRLAMLIEPHGSSTAGTILYFHGGWFVLGSPQTAVGIAGELVARIGARAFSLDYRLAPEHPYPAAIQDGVAAYRQLLENGSDPASVVFAGDSAGGGLAVTVCLAARDAGLPLPAAIIGLSPVLDHTFTGTSMREKVMADPFFDPETIRRLGALYLDGQDPAQSLLAPAVTGDLTGLPPVLLQAGTNELLLDDAVRFAHRATAAQVDVILDITADVPHVFQAYTHALDDAGRALDRAALFLTQHLARTQQTMHR